MSGERETRLAWHFLHEGGKLRTGEAAPPDGEWLAHGGPVVPCRSGLHASERALNALGFAPNDKPVLTRVELRGTVVAHGNPVDKLSASERRILWRLDEDTTERVLRGFARWCALQVIHLWEAPDVVRGWLETGDESLRAAARKAARAAAWEAAWYAAWEAAWYAAGAAAGEAAWYAAGSAARAAARDAAWYAAGAAAWDAAGAAAGEAAWYAAGSAAGAAQNAELERLFIAASEGQP